MSEEPTPPEDPTVLRNHEICRIWIDEEAKLQLQVDLPDNRSFQVDADVIALAHLVGKLNRLLGSLLESGTEAVLGERLKKS